MTVAFSVASTAHAGSYVQNFTGFANGTRNFGDGSSITSSGGTATGPNATVAVQNQALRMTAAGTTNSVSAAYRLPDLDPTKKLLAFNATFEVRMTKSGTTTPGQGWALNFGAIPATGNGNGEGGFSMPGGLVIAFDTYSNSAGDLPSIEVFANGVSIGNAPRTFPFDTTFRTVQVRWDQNGLDVGYDLNSNGSTADAGEMVFENLATPGFNPVAGNTFAFTARTASTRTEDVFLDNLNFVTTPETKMETGGPVISEFVADNSKLEDEDADKSDWVEIYNGQNVATDLTGWHLTDSAVDPAKWTFPSVTLGPYAYMIVFASGKNRTNPTAPLHANFSLSKGGEHIALIRPDGTTVASQYTFPAQTTDVSFGIQGVASTQGYFYPATPGRANTTEQAPGQPAEAVIWSTAGGLISGTTAVSVTTPLAAGSVVRYTTNNTPPDANSAVFPASVTVSGTRILRARVFTPGRLPGPVSTRSFLLLDPSLTNYNNSGQPFSSNLPILVLDSFGVPVDDFFDPEQPRPYQFASAVGLQPDSITNRAGITDAPNFQSRAGTHVRGNSSSVQYDQKPYALELRDEEDNDSNVSVFGLPADSDWVLSSPYPDKTLMRNIIPYTQMRKLAGIDGRAMRSMYVEVFFHQDPTAAVSKDDYRGVYLLVEKIKVDSNRLNLAKLNGLTVDPASVTGGYIIRHDWPDTSRSSFYTGQDVYLQGHDPETWNSPQRSYIQNYFSQFETALAGPNFADPATGYAAYIDADSFVDNYWFIEIHKNADGLGLSTYFTKDRGGKLKSAPIWDYDISAGNCDIPASFSLPTGWVHVNDDGSPVLDDFNKAVFYWYPRLLQDPNFAQRLWDRYWEIRRGPYATGTLTALINAQSAYLTNGNTSSITNNAPNLPPTQENAVQRHFRQWPILGTQVWPNPTVSNQLVNFDSHGDVNTGEVDWLKNWFTQRLAWMDNQNFSSSKVIYRPPNFNQYGGSITSGFQLAISRYTGTPPSTYTYASGGTLYYTTDGSDPRTSSGTVAASALPYSSAIPLTQTTAVKARLWLANDKWSPLTAATFVVDAVPAGASNLIISEFDYNPAPSTAAESAAGYNDPDNFEFVEFTNVGTQNIDLSGVNFTAGVGFTFNSTDPALRFLEPGARTLILRNPAAFQFRRGVLPGIPIAGTYGGRLDNGGEIVTLKAADTSTIASFTYDDVEPWPLDADGLGYSLVLNNPALAPAYGNATSWRSSAVSGGTPGVANSVLFTGSPTADTDGDGLSDLLEYAVGSAANNAASTYLPVMDIAPFVVDTVTKNYRTFAFRRNLAADGLSYAVEASPNLSSWTEGTAASTYVSTHNNGDGTATVTFRDNTPSDTAPRQLFMRLRVSSF